MKSTTSEKVIKALEECVDMLGIPYSITTDNGTQFISSEVEEYLARLDNSNNNAFDIAHNLFVQCYQA